VSQSTAPAAPAAQSSPQQASGPLKIASGSIIPVRLAKTIDAKKVKPGYEVEAKVATDLKATNGEVIMPQNTKVVGHITESQARSKGQENSRIGIAFDHAVMKNGENVPLPTSVQAIIAPSVLRPQTNNDNAASETAGAMPSPQEPGSSPASSSGRPGGMGSAEQPPTPSPATMGESPSPDRSSAKQYPPITAKTHGVVGISNLSLATPANLGQGSVVSSDKSNVKLPSGTLMLLRVNR
jgi:hypothetical protein